MLSSVSFNVQRPKWDVHVIRYYKIRKQVQSHDSNGYQFHIIIVSYCSVIYLRGLCLILGNSLTLHIAVAFRQNIPQATIL